MSQTEAQLKMHARAVHVKPKAFKCEDCGKTFQWGNKLKRHKLKHTNKRDFVCEEPNCGRAFTQTVHLVRHLKMHAGERDHKCAHCDKTFGQLCNMKKHLKVHAKPSHVKLT